MGALQDPYIVMQDLYVFELWNKVVERYSRTELSYPSDVLLAPASIARHFQRHLFSVTNTGCDYVAGLWSRNLESQLLWHINEQHQGHRFHNPAKRFAERGPSFPWASIVTPFGITYADITDYGASTRPDTDGGLVSVHYGRDT